MTANVVIGGNSITLKDWHERFGHISKDSIIKLVDIVNSLDIIDDDKWDQEHNHQCEPCTLRKQHRLPFKRVMHCAKKPLELVYSDLCSRFQI